MKRRVVITGMGMVSPVGNNVEDSFKAMLNGENGIDYIKSVDTSTWKVHIAGEVKDIDFEKYLDKKDIKRNDRVALLALYAAQEAYDQAKLENANIDHNRFGTYISSGIGGLNTILAETRTSLMRGPDRMSPFFVPNSIINLIGAAVAIRFGAKGPNIPIVTACSAGTNAIGEAYRAIKDGYIDTAIAGGSEAPINEIGVGGFASLRALSFTEDPKKACIPFDKNRNGFIVAEGAGVVVLEEYEQAIKRNVPIIAEIVGYAATSDAFHMTAPDEDADGITRCINLAMIDAKTTSEDIGYINAHGTSTQLNDRLETLGIKKALGDYAYNINISSTKSMTGHALGAAGGIECIAAIKALVTSEIPPTINLTETDEDCDLNYTKDVKVKRDMTHTMNINIGFGGQNAVIIFKKVE